MLSRSLDQETSKFKRQFWQDVATKLNAINGHALRTASEMHFKWRDWKSRTMRKVAQYQREAASGKTVDEKSNMTDIEQRLVQLLAGTDEEDDSDNGNSDAGGKSDEVEPEANDASISASASATRGYAFESFRSSASLPTQVNMRISKARAIVDNDDDHEHDHECSSTSPLSPSAKRLRSSYVSMNCNGNNNVEKTLTTTATTLPVGLTVNGCLSANSNATPNANANSNSNTSTSAAAAAENDAETTLRHAGTDHSVLLFTLLSTQLKQIQDLAEGQREHLKGFQDYVRKREKSDYTTPSGSGSLNGASTVCSKCTRTAAVNGNLRSPRHALPCDWSTRSPLLLDHPAPDLSGLAVLNETVQPFQLSSDMRNSFVLILFYPHDFTSESRSFLLAFNARLLQFQAARCQIVACSSDSQHAHLAWTRMRKDQGGLGQIDYVLLSDSSGENAMRYNVYNYHDGCPHYALIIVDDKGIVRHMTVTQSSMADVDGVSKLLKSLQ